MEGGIREMGALLGYFSMFGFLLCIIMLAISAIKKTGKAKGWVVGITISLACFVIALVISSNPTSPTGKPVVTSALASPVSIPAKTSENNYYSLGMTLTDFQNRFNQESITLNSPLKIVNLQMNTNGTIFTYRLANSVVLDGEINAKDDTLKWISLIMQTGTEQAGIDNVNSIMSAFAATVPEIPAKDRGNILQELGLLSSGVDISTIDNKTIHNGKIFRIKGLGNSAGSNFVTLTISNVNDPEDHAL